MNMILDAPAPELTIIEERQPDVPLVCTSTLISAEGDVVEDPCDRQAHWEALCMACGHIFRRCEEHYQRDIELSTRMYWDLPDGAAFRCLPCGAPVFPEQYVRISA